MSIDFAKAPKDMEPGDKVLRVMGLTVRQIVFGFLMIFWSFVVAVMLLRGQTIPDWVIQAIVGMVLVDIPSPIVDGRPIGK
mgnify:CR=1 FL=1